MGTITVDVDASSIDELNAKLERAKQLANELIDLLDKIKG